MERKTIGKFIAVLRKANGLTQADLAEKLFVSDKTVSRWERDESTPDLELIPLIADLFGVTTDEILRGERVSNQHTSGKNTDEGELEREKEKMEKRYKKLFDKKYLKFKNLSFISYGIVLLGFIAAMICIFCVHSDKVDEEMLGSWVLVACLVVAFLCQTVFVRLGAYHEDEEENVKAVEVYHFKFKKAATKSFLVLFAMLGLTLPLFLIDQINTDNFNTVLPFICLFCAIGFYFIGNFSFWIYNKTQKNKQEMTLEQLKVLSKLQKRVFLPTIVVAVVLLMAATAIYYGTSTHHFSKSITFNTTEEFVTFMEQKTDWGDLEKEPFSGSTLQSGGSDGFYWRVYGEWTKVGRSDVRFFWANESVVGYTVSKKNDGLPIKVYEKDDYTFAETVRMSVVQTTIALSIIALGTGGIVYVKKRKKLDF